ncbi:SNF2 family helicase protein [Rhizobium phage RHph_X2_30]|nr:SNF2 family helicase protein [Rhizobium phage RHph_X2_30]
MLTTLTPFERFLEQVLEPVAELESESPFERFLRDVFLVDIDNPISGLRPESLLRSYQSYLADCIVDMEYLLGAAEMSLGKTAATLTGVRRLLRKFPQWRCIIVAPLEVAKNTWPEEIAEWEHLTDLTYTVVCGDEQQRLAALKVDADLTIINRENLGWLWQTIGGDAGWRWQILVYDESSRLKGFTFRTPNKKKDPKTGETVKRKPTLTEFGVLAQARKRMKRVIELTGTPSPNGVRDLGGQAYILDQGQRLGINKTKFENRWFDKNQFTKAVTPKAHAKDEIMGLMKDVMIGLRSQDYIDLPPQVFNPVYVNLSPKLMKEYREFEKTLVAQNYDVEAVSRGVLTGKLLQFANGGLYRLDEDVYDAKRETIAIHDYKLKALESIVEEAAGQNILVAYSFQFDKERIRKKFPKAVFFDEEPNFVKKWNAGKIQMGVSHPASIGHGLNLQHGGHIQVWFGCSWSLELWDQFNRRLARPGQKNHSVFIHVILARGTMDETQYETLQIKGVTQDQIMNAVRVRLKK